MDAMEILAKYYFRFYTFWIIFYFHYGPYGICSLQKENICNANIFSPKCGPNEVIFIRKALYGRMTEGICRTINLGYLGCSADVLNVVDVECSARSSCSLIVGYDAFKVDPCSQIASYLDVEYDCQKVVTSGFSNCKTCEGIETTASTGYLASEISFKTSCGSSRCPWKLKADEGQTIEFILYDFSDKSLKDSTKNCHLYAVIVVNIAQEGDNQRSAQICGSQIRKSKAHVSQSNEIKIYLVHENRNPFLIQYKFIGCADINDKDMIFSRQGNEAKIKCKNSNEEYNIECVNNEWKGFESITCRNHKEARGRGFSTVSWDLWAILISSICFMLGCFIIVFGLWSFCRDRSQGNNQFPIKIYEDIYNEPIPTKRTERRFREPHTIDQVFNQNQAFKDFPSDYGKHH